MARNIRPSGEAADDALIHQALQRRSQEHFTAAPPKTLQSRIKFLLKTMSAKEIGQAVGVEADSINRYRRGARRNPPAAVAAKIDELVRARWQPRVRQKAQKRAATRTGITVETRASFGYSAPYGTTDEPRPRRITAHLGPDYARRLFDAERGIGDQSPNEVIAEGLRDVYFQDNGHRAQGLDVEFTRIDYIDVSY